MPRAEILHDRYATPLADRDELAEGDLRDEAALLEVRAVHLQQQAGLRRDRVLVVASVGAVRRAHFDELHPCSGEDFWDAEGAADLDQLAPRDDHFAAAGEGVEREQHGGGAVVRDGRGARTREQAQLGLESGESIAALAAREIEFEIRVVGGGLRDRRRGGITEHRAPEVRVHHDAAGVHHLLRASAREGTCDAQRLGAKIANRIACFGAPAGFANGNANRFA